MTKISCLYFGETKKKTATPSVLKMPPQAQFIAFILLGSTDQRRFFTTMQNDIVMMMYLVIGIYMFARNRPLISCFFVAIAYSVKAAVLLIFPAYFGAIMHTFGTKTLLKGIVLIYGF